MAAFEFGNYPERPGRPPFGPQPAPPPQEAKGPAFGPGPVLPGPPVPPVLPVPTRSEPLLAMKIYDSCRHKNCLGVSEIGPAKYAHGAHAGENIVPPPEAHSVRMADMRVRSVVISGKEPSPFRKGFWDMEVRYIFDYELCYFADNGEPRGVDHATSSFVRRVSLFGSIGADITMATDLFHNTQTVMGGEPFVMVEARALGLSAEIARHHCHRDDPPQVHVTLGLFSIIKLFRMVSLLVESRGFVIPPECGDIIPPNPCDFFDELDFPMGDFAPPQRREFMAGTSGDITSEAAALGEALPE